MDQVCFGLEFKERLKFNVGNVGLAGFIQVLELTSQYPSTVDTMRRFGGSMLPAERAEGCHCAFGDAQKFKKGSRPGDRMGASGGYRKNAPPWNAVTDSRKVALRTLGLD